jgi:hypothetical protein
MKKTLIIMFGISMFAGAGYFVWAFTPLGKTVLSKWLLKKWKQAFDEVKATMDEKKLAAELMKLNYEDHEMLVRFTRMDILRKAKENRIDKETEMKAITLLQKMTFNKLFQRADLSSLDDIIIPSKFKK